MIPYRSWTTCKPVNDIDPFEVWTAETILALISGIILAIIALIAIFTGALANPIALAIAAGALSVAAIAASVKVYNVKEYFLHGRLVCIADKVCAIGRVFSLEDDADGDQSLNLVLAPATEDHSEDEYRQMFQSANLIYPDPGVEAVHGWDHDPHSNTKWLREAGDHQNADFAVGFQDPPLPLFHCEIEGTALVDYLDRIFAWLILVAAIAAGIAIAAAVLGALGPIGWIILGVLILLTIIFGTLLDTEDDLTDSVPAEAPEIDGALPSADGPVVIVNDDNTALRKGDIIVIMGRHVCDTAHHEDWGCWNEIHPVKGILKINRPIPVEHGIEVPDLGEELYTSVSWNQNDDTIVEKYCSAVRNAFDPSFARTEATLTHKKVG